MYYLVLTIHVVVCVILIGIILLQGGRGGLGEALGGGGSQSLFGGGTNTLIAKITAVGGGLFFVTCLTLAMFSTARGRSVIEKVPAVLPEALNPMVQQGAIDLNGAAEQATDVATDAVSQVEVGLESAQTAVEAVQAEPQQSAE